MFRINEIVWAKVKGYPWWPAVIRDIKQKPSERIKVSYIGHPTQ